MRHTKNITVTEEKELLESVECDVCNKKIDAGDTLELQEIQLNVIYANTAYLK